MGEMMFGPASAWGRSGFAASLARFHKDERGAMAFLILFFFIMMLMFGGIAVDVMRFETRRVAMQNTMDRAALAAANLNNTVGATEVVDDYYAKAELGEGLTMVDFSKPVVTPSGDNVTFKKVEVSSKVRSRNFFMHLLNVDYLEGPTTTTAEQGVSTIEVIMVLDVSGSMRHAISSGDPKSKIQQLRESATNFATILKSKDIKNEVSIGLVPYHSQVHLTTELREQFNATNIPSYNGVAGAVFPNAECLELPNSSYGSMALDTTTAIPMAAVADTQTDTDTTSNYRDPVSFGAPVNDPINRICNPTTNNKVFLPSKTTADITGAIATLTHGGYTSIAIGMRWGTALIDQSARDIYTDIGHASVAGRPANNNALTTRKIIVLMTDGQNDDTLHVPNAFKTGPSPIWRGADGRYAIRFTTGGPALTGNARPTCAGTNTYFVPHLKPNTSTSCNSAAWKSTLTGTPWTGSGTVRRLDWSEVWQSLRVTYVARQLYGRSNVTGVGYSTVMNTLAPEYIDDAVLTSLLDQNCTAAKAAGVEVFGIAFAAPSEGQTQISNCSSNPKSNYYYNATNNEQLNAAFNLIANQISELRLTQ
jgi:Flp pilus assembly protein TadG